MLMGTLVGVFFIPGLYYIFAKMSDGKKLIRDESDRPLSEYFEEDVDGESDSETASDSNADSDTE